MLEVLGRSDDDPPIFALRVAGRRAAEEVGAWLRENEGVRHIRVFTGGEGELPPSDVEELIREHGVEIQVAEFQGVETVDA